MSSLDPAYFQHVLRSSQHNARERLDDRLAVTQVVDGYGAKDLALDIQALLENLSTQLGVSTGRRRRAPARVDRAA
jgi:hypothetical protein